MNNFSKNLALWVIIGLLLIALFNLFQSPTSRGPQTSLAFSDFLSEVDRRPRQRRDHPGQHDHRPFLRRPLLQHLRPERSRAWSAA